MTEQFARIVEQEFVHGSAIDPILYQAAVRVVADVEVRSGGEVETPLHDALNWRFTRFGQQAKQAQFGAILRNEDGSAWQVKLSRPRIDKDKGKPQKYETPIGNGSRGYFPPVPAVIRQRIGARYGVEVPLDGSFWRWLEQHPEIPLLWTEGGKKALCLLSLGYVAIALYGVNGGYRRQVDDTRSLIPDVARFAQGRQHYLVFDQDAAPHTQRRVNVAIFRFSGLLEQAGGTVQIVSWQPEQGKGVDDFIVSAGEAGFAARYQEAMSLIHWSIWQRLQRQLTYPAQLRLDCADLSQMALPDVPERGIIGLRSAKGTGKTKFIGALVNTGNKVLSATHRIALGRNLCARLGLDWRGDLDKVNGQFINGGGYTLRVGFCVDSMLAIMPEQFAGCDLILDEAVQVVRHLVTSSTCARDGKRPSLLARFRELVQAARRVIAADADLDNVTLAYLQELRGADNERMFVVRNDFQPPGYPVTFLESADRTAITTLLLEALPVLPLGKTLFVVTDSKRVSKEIAALIAKEHPEKATLLINSETSGGERERGFIHAPDATLQSNLYDVIICSPSLATGVSIEATGKVTTVYGIFTGASASDSDIAQALGRVREPVPRVIWCARTGSNYAKGCRSERWEDVRYQLEQSTSATVRLVRASLQESTVDSLEAFGWQDNPHLRLYCQLSAGQNCAMRHLRDALLVRLRWEGHTVRLEQREKNPALKLLLSDIREGLRRQEAADLVAVEDLSYSDVLALEQRESLAPEDHLAIAKYYVKDFYGLNTLTIEDVLWDNDGQRRSEILNLEAQLHPELSAARTVRQIEKQAAWGKGVCPWDVSQMELRRKMRSLLGLDELIAKLRNGWEWTKHELASYAVTARALAAQVKVALNFSIHEGVGDTQIVHQLLAGLGIKLTYRWSRSVPGYEGEKLRVYSLDAAHWARLEAVLERRQAKREGLEAAGSPSQVKERQKGGDPVIQGCAEMLQAALEFGLDAVRDAWLGIPEELWEEVLAMLPGTVARTVQLLDQDQVVPVLWSDAGFAASPPIMS